MKNITNNIPKIGGYMTVVEIGKAIGKDERTIRRWILKTKRGDMAFKLEEARKNKKAAQYTTDEVLDIVKMGLKEIDLFMFNKYITTSSFERFKMISEAIAKLLLQDKDLNEKINKISSSRDLIP